MIFLISYRTGIKFDFARLRVTFVQLSLLARSLVPEKGAPFGARISALAAAKTSSNLLIMVPWRERATYYVRTRKLGVNGGVADPAALRTDGTLWGSLSSPHMTTSATI